MEDRLEHIRKKLKNAKMYYSRYSPQAEMMYEVDEADDDVRWMIHEIERLRSFVVCAGDGPEEDPLQPPRRDQQGLEP